MLQRWKTPQQYFETNQVVIRVNLDYLEAKTAFPYLGRTVTYNNSNWEEFYSNFIKSQRIQGISEKVLGKTGAPIKS